MTAQEVLEIKDFSAKALHDLSDDELINTIRSYRQRLTQLGTVADKILKSIPKGTRDNWNQKEILLKMEGLNVTIEQNNKLRVIIAKLLNECKTRALCI